MDKRSRVDLEEKARLTAEFERDKRLVGHYEQEAQELRNRNVGRQFLLGRLDERLEVSA